MSDRTPLHKADCSAEATQSKEVPDESQDIREVLEKAFDCETFEEAVEVCRNYKPTPAQKWTPQWLANFGKADNWLESICEAHNASLAAERERGNFDRVQELASKYRDVMTALGLEIATHEKVIEAINKSSEKWSKEIQRLELALNESEDRYAKLLARTITTPATASETTSSGNCRTTKSAQEWCTKVQNDGMVAVSCDNKFIGWAYNKESADRIRIAHNASLADERELPTPRLPS